MTPLTVLCAAPRRPAGVDAPGGALPYGMGELAARFDLRWTDARDGVRGRLRARVDGAVRRVSPGRRGWSLGREARHASGAVLSVFEDAGLAFARARRRDTRHVMVACWLAQDVQDRPGLTASLRRSLASVSIVCVYSGNQVEILAERLAIPQERIRVVPFGVDTAYYDAQRVTGPGGGGGVVAVGSDSRRDYATLFAAVEQLGLPLTLACHPRNLVGIRVPEAVTRVSVFDADYRALLHSADVVVTPTTAPAYPSGQSVALEAMAMGRATITTDSPAMRDYVEDGATGFLSPVGDVDALAHRLGTVLADDDLRRRVGGEAALRVRQRFGARQQWGAVAGVLAEVAA